MATVAAPTPAGERMDRTQADVRPLPRSARLIGGSANPQLAEAVEHALGARAVSHSTQWFPDGEVFTRLDESVRGLEVVILQPTSPPVNDHLVELLALADACRRAAARHIVAVIPYFGYARSDRRDGRRTAIMGSLVAELLEHAGINHVITLDAHTPALEGFFHVALDNLSAAPVLAEALRPRMPSDAVIVSPDLGATRLAQRYATLLHTPVAICHKSRLSGSDVSVSRVTGEVSGRACVIVDDMITTGATIVESVRALREAGASTEIVVAATHPVLVPGALRRLEDAGIRELVVTDSIPISEAQAGEAAVPREVVSIAPLLATAIQRLLGGGSLRELA